MNTYRAIECPGPGGTTWDIEWSQDGIVRGRVCQGFRHERDALYWVYQLAHIEAVNKGALGG